MAKHSSLSAFNALRDDCERLGLLAPSPWRASANLALALGLYGLAVSLHRISPAIAFASACAGGVTLVWWIHDAGHDALTSSQRLVDALIEGLGLVFLGMPQIEYHRGIHRRHHRWTNVIGQDGALATNPVIWHPLQAASIPAWWARAQPWLWFFVVLPLTWPLITLRCIRTLIEERKVLRLTLLILRWIAVAVWLPGWWGLIIGSTLVTGFVLGFYSSMNHFPCAMDERPLGAFPLSIFLTTQNLGEKGAFFTWLSGGLNFHIEHHLFPTAPSYRLRQLAPQVQAFAISHALPYRTCTTTAAVAAVWRRLAQPAGDVSRGELTGNSEPYNDSLERPLAPEALQR